MCSLVLYLGHLRRLEHLPCHCLSITRTVSLFKPFKHQKSKYLIVAVVVYFLLKSARTIGLSLQEGPEIIFYPWYSRCVLFIANNKDAITTMVVLVSDNLVYTAPAVVVATSCVLSVVLLTGRRNRHVQQRELQKSRNRATVTILLFALVYGVCNIALVVNYILWTYSWGRGLLQWYFSLYRFDKQRYYFNTTHNLLLAVNSAANPILYFWRMPPLREFTKGRLNRARRRMGHQNNVNQPGFGSRGSKNNTVTSDLPAVAPVETGF